MGMEAPLSGPELDSLKSKLQQHGQAHLLDHWESLTDAQQKQLYQELAPLDYAYLRHIFQASQQLATTDLKHVQPAQDVVTLADMTPAQRKQWTSSGLDMIAEGKLGVLLLAGGQGTRLGSSRPKGCYDIQLPSHKSLFCLQAERIAKVQQLAAVHAYGKGAAVRKPMQWYIMTSATTDAETKQHFQEHNYFGLQPDQVTFFQQGWLPGFTLDGKIILEGPTSVFKAPDGNGGIYVALEQAGVLQHMRTHSVEAVDCFGVDNVLVRPGDPLFSGYCWQKKAQCGARVVAKAYPEEKVGVFAVDEAGNTAVVEYSEMDPAEAASVDPETGALRFNWSNVCMHYFSVDYLETVSKELQAAGVYHIAKKNIKGLQGPVDGIKLELFIFDVFPMAQRIGLMEVARNEQFAPVKNAPGSGVDSPDTARELVLQLHTQWVTAAGGTVKAAEGVEVSPLVSYAGEGLEDVCAGVTFAESGDARLAGGTA